MGESYLFNNSWDVFSIIAYLIKYTSPFLLLHFPYNLKFHGVYNFTKWHVKTRPGVSNSFLLVNIAFPTGNNIDKICLHGSSIIGQLLTTLTLYYLITSLVVNSYYFNTSSWHGYKAVVPKIFGLLPHFFPKTICSLRGAGGKDDLILILACLDSPRPWIHNTGMPE